MVSSKIREISSKFRAYNKNEVLTDWIRNVRSKKIMKKKESRGQDLRTLAILTAAIVRSEEELKKKREERAQKWAQIRNRLNENINNYTISESNQNHNFNSAKLDEEEQKQKEEAKALWHSELNGLDNFINNLNSIKTTVIR